MEIKFKNKQIIQQGGSWTVLMTPAVMKHNGFALGDIVNITVKHSKENFDEKQSDLILVRLAGQKMKELGTNRLVINLKDEIEIKGKPDERN